MGFPFAFILGRVLIEALCVFRPLGGRHAAVTAAVTIDDKASGISMSSSSHSHSAGGAHAGSSGGIVSKPPSPAAEHDHGGGEAVDDDEDREREHDSGPGTGGNTSYVRGTPSDRDRSSPPHPGHGGHGPFPPSTMREGGPPSLPSIDSFGQHPHQHPRRTPQPPPAQGQQQAYSPVPPPSVPSGMRGLINPYGVHEGHVRRVSSPVEYTREGRLVRRSSRSSSSAAAAHAYSGESPAYSSGSGGHG